MTRDDLKFIKVLLDEMQEVMTEIATRRGLGAEYKSAEQCYENLRGWLEAIPNE